MAGTRIEADVIVHAESAVRGFRDAASSAVLAARGARQLADSLKLQSKTADVSAAATLALAKSDKVLRDAELELAGAADETSRNLRQQGRAAEDAAVKTRLAGAAAKGAGGGFGVLASPMGAAVAAGVALSPVIATVGTGLGGLALAAYGVAKPIADAAQKAGGLRANMSKLDPEQQAVARSLLGLQKQYDTFQNALKPEVLGIFGRGLSIASGLLHDIQPVTVATGKAFGTLLGRVDAEFRSGTWQQFFGFMAKNAGPDVQLLGNLLVDLMNDLPPLLTALQPVATGFLKLADGAVRAAGDVGQLIKKAQVNTGEHGNSVFDEIKRFVNWGGTHLPGHNKSVLQLAESWLHLSGGADAAAKSMTTAGGSADFARRHIYSLAQQVQGLTDKEDKALSPMLAYTNSLLAQADDGGKLRAALKASHDTIGLHTHAEEDSFKAAQTYIQDLLNTASAAVQSHQGIDTQIGSIRTALPLLENVKGGTKEYWQEVKTLQHWLDVLQHQKAITEGITILGNGKWVNQATGTVGGLGGHTAKGWLVSGGTPGTDSVPIMAMPGELVVPTKMVSAGLVDHLRGMIPGFAGGGIIPSYTGPVAGLQPWAAHNRNATISAITAAIAGSMTQAMKAMAAGGTGGGNVTRWAPLILQALAMLRQDSSNLGPVEHRMSQESGGNPFAINLTDINAQRGDPSRGLMQVIGATFARYRSFALPDDIYNPLANIFAGLNYAVNAYPGRSLSSVMLQAGGYDRGGYLRPGLTLAWNGTGRPEPVLPASRGGGNVTLVLENHGVIGSEAELRNWLHRNIDALAMQGQLSWALRQSPSAP